MQIRCVLSVLHYAYYARFKRVALCKLGAGQRDNLTYQSLISQIEKGLNKGYTEKEVVTAVISVQSKLTYLEGLTGIVICL